MYISPYWNAAEKLLLGLPMTCRAKAFFASFKSPLIRMDHS